MPAINAFDLSAVEALAAIRTPLGLAFFSLATNLGGALAVCIVIIVAFIVVEESKRWAYGAGMLFAVCGSMALAEIGKITFVRRRPPESLRAIYEIGYSFPSEHATAAAALYGFLAFAAWRIGPHRYRMFIAVVCAGIVVLVAFSRVYLGVHYPSDCLSGVMLGSFFAWWGARITHWLHAKKYFSRA